MNRSRRVSRPLIGVLGAVVVLGIFFYLHNLKKSHADEARARADVSRPASADAAAPLDSSYAAIAAGHALPAAFTASGSTTQPVALITQTPGLGTTAATSERHTDAGMRVHGDIAADSASTAQHPNLDTQSSTSPIPAHSNLSPSAALADGKSKKDSGDLLAARAELSESLLSGKLSPADSDGARQLLAEISQTVVFSPKKFPDDPFGGAYAVLSGERLSTIAAKNGVTWEFLARINGIEPRRLRSGATIKIIKGPFHAVVSKSLFRMDLYLGSPGDAGAVYLTSFPVGLGKDGSTPTGVWQVEAGNKIRHPKYYSPRGEGVIDADDPKNPLGGYWVGLAGLEGQATGKNSYGIHGTIDPNSIGKQESMGCIRLKSEDIAQVFDLLVEGKSKVVVKD